MTVGVPVEGRLLRRSPRRTVVVEGNGEVVRKTFHGGDPEVLRQLAEVECVRLSRFREALAGVPHATCPRPLGVEPGSAPSLRMERCLGLPLLSRLRAGDLDAGTMRTIAVTAASAVIAYVRDLGEPYHDFQFDNMLYDERSGVVTFLDLGLPDGGGNCPPTATALDMSLGNLVGSTMFQSARPKWMLRIRQHRQAEQLCSAVVARSAQPGIVPVSPRGLREAALAAYARSAFQAGVMRRAWYAGAGHVLARRPTILDGTVAPPRPGSGYR